QTLQGRGLQAGDREAGAHRADHLPGPLAFAGRAGRPDQPRPARYRPCRGACAHPHHRPHRGRSGRFAPPRVRDDRRTAAPRLTPLTMNIDGSTLDRIAELARLDMSDPAAREAMLADMERVLGFVERLNQVDTTGVEPLIFMTEGHDVLRD